MMDHPSCPCPLPLQWDGWAVGDQEICDTIPFNSSFYFRSFLYIFDYRFALILTTTFPSLPHSLASISIHLFQNSPSMYMPFHQKKATRFHHSFAFADFTFKFY